MHFWRMLRDGLSNPSEAAAGPVSIDTEPKCAPGTVDEDVTTHDQVAALVWRKAGKKKKIEVLLITSRDTGRWVLPKGWVEHREDGAEAAKREAWEEAGVEGTVQDEPVGHYRYDKTQSGDEPALPCIVAVYALAVKRQAKDWPERDERERNWVSPAKAAKLVDEPELQELLDAFGTDWKKLAA